LFSHLQRCFLTQASRQKAKAKATALKTELVKKRKVDKETNAEPRTLSNKRHKINASRDFISHDIYIYKELDVDFNFLKIHMMSHWANQVRQYGSLQQYSAQINGQVHKTNLMDG
jgi:hypothetical protein